MKNYRLEYKNLVFEDIPLDRLTSQLQRQGLEVSLPHEKKFGEWQCCPVCNGSGRAMNYDNQVPSYLDICTVCKGDKIIQRPIITTTP